MNVIGKNDTKVLNLQKNTYLPLLILLITFVSINQWSALPVGNTYIVWGIEFLSIFFFLWYKRLYWHPSNIKDYTVVKIYFVWMIIGAVRGIFVAENYWEWKQLISGTTALALPMLVYVFSQPDILQRTLYVWIRWALPLFFLFFMWLIALDVYHFYLSPIFFLACFLPIIKFEWRCLLIVLLLIMIIGDLGARSQIIKAAATLLMSGAYLIGKYLSDKMLKFVHRSFYLATVTLLVLGISGVFNVFESLSEYKGKYTQKKYENGEIISVDVADDTRTFIYVEVIESALRHNYWLWGRTPARGNDSFSFGNHMAEELKTGKYERHANEVCFPNIFTWLGLTGMILYCLIYLKSSYLAVYKSNNLFMKLAGIFIAFRFLVGWIEDVNKFDITSFSLWMMIAMCFSEQFRKMNNSEFENWIKKIFM
jgi:hypothetical protein